MPAANYEAPQHKKVTPSPSIESKLKATDSLKPQVEVTVKDKVRTSSAAAQPRQLRSVDEPHSR